ncbi:MULTISPECIES: DUF6772 family protein [unclassified Chelatococcus]|uniref:DUF6772 family protein n=1 Tax=unclassified Chelatococcus TaxID=2638111 RepID=UPI001BCE9655|nr:MULTISPECIES: DUF6772 family protein [unclassified Chelatococcus]MBS7699678.1 hypothetical protein [Chelatococcus sp. YT9]MBX3557124.1 hypothetical protein [Chelatococcus sp.]
MLDGHQLTDKTLELALSRAIRRSDPLLSRFNPLPRILFVNDFDDGSHGWCELSGNHDNNLDSLRRMARDLRPPQLSSLTFFDTGTHGSIDGTYALKLATRPRANHMSQAIKRFTYVKRGLVQFEMYFTFKAETIFNQPKVGERAWDGNFHPSASQFGDFTISNDVGEGENGERYHCALRYQNTDHAGKLIQRWQYKTSVQPTTMMEKQGLAQSPEDYHVCHPDDWEPIPGGHQPLCYNEIPTKTNWHYLRWVFDTEKRANTELQVNDLTMDLRDLPVPRYDHPYWGCERLLNFCLDVRTHCNVRNFLWVDSVVASVDW